MTRRALAASLAISFIWLATPSAAVAQPVLEEILVTAQKREQSVQDVPIAITAMSGEAMREAGVFSVRDLTDVNPSVSFETGQSSQNASLKIRGIGSVGNGRTFEGAVGVFIDGVYRSRSGMALSDMNDIDRLEILRGPQGTLFGKNTVAGALSLSSTLPSSERMGGRLELIGGSYSKEFASAAINVPVGRDNAFRFSFVYNQEDGHIRSPQQGRTYNATDRYGLKLQWLSHITDTLTAHLILDYSNSDAACCWGSTQIISGPLTETVEYYANLRGLEFYTAPGAEKRRHQNINQDSRELREDQGLTLRLSWSWDALDLQSISGVRRFEEEQIRGDADFGPAHLLILDEPSVIDFWSQEFNATFRLGPVDVVTGLYYSKEKFDSQRTISADTDTDNYINTLATRQGLELVTGTDMETGALCRPPQVSIGCLFQPGTFQFAPPAGEPVSIEGYNQEAISYAAYLHTQTRLGQRWNLVAGIRYSVDEKEGGYDNRFWYGTDGAQLLVASGLLGTPPSGDANTPRNGFDLAGLFWSPSFNEKVEDRVATSTLSLQYEVNAETMTYLTYSRGYKSGAVNLFNEAFNFDNTTYKPEYAEGYEIGLKTRYWDGRAQTNVALFRTDFTDLQINFFTGINFFTVNTGEATTEGLEIENSVQLTRGLRADLNLTFLDAKFGDLSAAPERVRFLSGRETPRAPSLAGVAVLSYERPIGERLAAYSRISASYMGKHFANADTVDEPKQGPYTLIDLTLGLRGLGDSSADISVFCRNCSDEMYRTIYFATPVQFGSFNAYLNTPRVFGLSLRYQY